MALKHSEANPAIVQLYPEASFPAVGGLFICRNSESLYKIEKSTYMFLYLKRRARCLTMEVAAAASTFPIS